MSKKTRLRFDEVACDILESNDFQALKMEIHHGTSRYDHLVRVAKMTYRITKYTSRYNRDYTRAALLHDFYYDYEMDDMIWFGVFDYRRHPRISAERADVHFDLNKRQKNMIESHMFPFPGRVPRNYGSLVLMMVDKIVATYEVGRWGVMRVTRIAAMKTAKSTQNGVKKAVKGTRNGAKKVAIKARNTKNRVKNSKVMQKRAVRKAQKLSEIEKKGEK
ncbi:HD domain-containing protein [Candidatus Saccharibacteria bacterium]|nr:HD domain-containing protein [Candidatus Saccharibacteria bacterium]